MIKPTLLVLAAGMGSRYGSLKQMDGVGPNGETIIDYSVYDAIAAGFGQVVLVVGAKFEAEFKEIFSAERFGHKIEVHYVTQQLDSLPQGFVLPVGREKPWGTAHAVLMAAKVIDGPFAVVNADDFYGRDAIEVMGRHLAGVVGKKGSYAMVGYEISKTLSENGTVSRGVCSLGRCSTLNSLVERTKIERQGGQIVYIDNDQITPLDQNTLVSMNLFGFTADIFEHTANMFVEFLETEGDNLRSEFYIPLVVNQLIASGRVKMKVLRTSSEWFGVTYIEDKSTTVARIAELTQNGVYPCPLWSK